MPPEKKKTKKSFTVQPQSSGTATDEYELRYGREWRPRELSEYLSNVISRAVPSSDTTQQSLISNDATRI